MPHETVIVGAGVAGLSCARALRGGGLEPQILERSRGVGGRCATRRFEGQSVDHGLSFLHGSDADFISVLQASGDGLTGWPLRVVGRGTPCQPRAFFPGEFRVAFADGVNVFAKRQAAGFSVQREAKVTGLRVVGGELEVAVAGQVPRLAQSVVLALALEQSLQLLRTLPPGLSAEVDGAQALLAMEESVPCLTVVASYDLSQPEPPWDVCYPEDSAVIGLISHDSSKRSSPVARVLVFQALPRYSREQLGSPEETWVADVLREAGRILGPWATLPRQHGSQRWRYARVEQSALLAAPLLLPLPGGARLGICGDMFAPSGGVEAAWLSGHRLGSRILAEE